MADKYQNKYRIPSARASWWDYGNNASYFVTICTHNREHFFGEVVDHEMRLTEIGESAYDCWNEIPNHFPFVVLDVFVVMPNHVHGIIIIDKLVDGANMGDKNMDGVNMDGVNVVKTQNFASLRQSTQNKFGPQSQNLASIIRGLKIGVTKFAKSKNIGFGWQPRFHDHIIRNEESYQRIRNYIITNPKNWHSDKFKK